MSNNFKNFLEIFGLENHINPTEAVNILSNAIMESWQKSFGGGYELAVEITSNGINLFRMVTTVKEITDHKTEIIGDSIGIKKKEKIPLDMLDRNAVFNIKYLIKKQLQISKKQEEYEKYLPQVGQLFVCTFLRQEGYDLIVKVSGNSDGVIPRFLSANEQFRRGDKICCLLFEVKQNPEGYQLCFDRKSPNFITALLKNMIPEIGNGTITIEKIIRDPSSLCKVLVKGDYGIGACFGPEGKRRRDIINELRGEKIDFIQAFPLMEKQIMSAFSRIKIIHLNIHNEQADMVIPDDQMKDALGRRGQNASMISKLIGINIRLISETDYILGISEKLNEQIQEMCNFGISKEEAESLLYQHKDILRIPEDKRNPLVNELWHKKFEEKKQDFIALGGDSELFGIHKLIPVDVYFKLIEQHFATITALSPYKNPSELSQDAKIEFHWAIFLIEGLRAIGY